MKTKSVISGEMEHLMAAYTSCDTELGLERGITIGENQMTSEMLDKSENCPKCPEQTSEQNSQVDDIKCSPDSANRSNQNSAIVFMSYIGVFMVLFVF